MFIDVLRETLERVFYLSIIIFPLLFLVEWANHKYGDRLISFFEKRKHFMPFWAALLALLPGCNVAAAVAVLYAKRLVSVGTLAAAMIATSDEAIYVFLPERFNFLPLYVAKFVTAVFAGFLFDLFSKKIATALKIEGFKVGYCCSIHQHVHDLKGMTKHVLVHGAKIIFFIFVVLFSFNFVKDFFGIGMIGSEIQKFGVFEPLVTGLFGLVPGCGTSVVIATLFTQKIIGFAAAFSGLSVAAGDTILVLLANKVPKKEIFTIISVVFVIVLLVSYAFLYFRIPFFS